MEKRLNVALIIPAYNEAARIPAVLSALEDSRDLWHELLVVDDGSTDGSASVARGMGARVHELHRNRGKGAAMWAGAQATDAEVLCFLDADLRGLTRAHVEALLQPVLRGEAEMTVGLFRGGRGSTDLSHRVAPWVSGQRAILRRSFLQVPQIAASRQGVEALLTRAARTLRWRVVDVPWAGVTHAMKEEKLGPLRGFLARLRMYGEITAGLLQRRPVPKPGRTRAAAQRAAAALGNEGRSE